MEKGNLAKAIIAVMKAVKGIDKTTTVGAGISAYSGVSDQLVKKIIGHAMTENGLTILPLDIEAKTIVNRWDEVDQYSKETPKATKSKQSVFTEVTTKYLLLHESGESQVISGYGHGVDSQDKGAGKATTYALKYALLYSFLVPTGKIDDADSSHSDAHEVAKVEVKKEPKPLVPLIENTERYYQIVEALEKGITTIDKVKIKNSLTDELETKLKSVKLIKSEK